MSSFDEFENPYRSLEFQPKPGLGAPGEMTLRRGKVGQVKLLGVLMMVHGVVLFILAGVMGFYAATVPQAVLQQGQLNQPNGPPAEVIANIMTIVFIVIAGVFAITALLNIIGGVQVMRFRGRVLSMIALFSGLTTILACYCFPISLGMAIYGMIVLLDISVQAAYRMADEGASAEEIRQYFDQLPV